MSIVPSSFSSSVVVVTISPVNGSVLVMVTFSGLPSLFISTVVLLTSTFPSSSKSLDTVMVSLFPSPLVSFLVVMVSGVPSPSLSSSVTVDTAEKSA
ncbi:MULTISPECIES: hypothetical protein [Pasteurellaceae]|uniref:hypothetical protein n=1 Tax=Pasteurellaceae TaxID=712 RepID=UPI00276F53AD|nr:hypothetical protein [Pasteurella atlantica]MDP8056699.1 hypothetical protein [Pasteurella atlantica]MDP8092334.1 hypothetical protein [Pasteurella atlantica]